jgi:hypothetical protein
VEHASLDRVEHLRREPEQPQVRRYGSDTSQFALSNLVGEILREVPQSQTPQLTYTYDM